MYCRRPTIQRINAHKERDEVLTLPQIRHIVSMVASGEMPDMSYGEEELVLYEMLTIFNANPKRFCARTHEE